MYDKKKERGRSAKCFVCVLASFVILCALLLLLASIMRVREPRAKIRSATSNKITHNASPSSSPSFNATLIIFMTIQNPNFGVFTYDNSSMSVLYAGAKIGDTPINGDKVSFRKTKQINVTVDLRSAQVPVTGNFSGDMNSGTLNLTSYAKFSGTVRFLKIMNVKKSIEMACAMKLNFTSHLLQDIQC
ncbi:late embryogenesis abundant protein At1g64065 [Vigna unguiculata]|uniref:Late embryogenesis abundant protein n=1 Tax=Vigna unguiculata TaxID=3917 RepID=A0A4D6LRZ1_VIGUN|nr:late embryogenesis abundant protein At1g64065 [Vigna unguiculata]QCD91692.1 Late embryogenesis abundant protein [Vigna unguiculata]